MNVPGPDPYALLGVTAEATDDDLDHAFRCLVRQLHPDTRTSSGLDADADQHLQELLTAYATLRDPIRRAAYDRARTGPAPTNGAPQRGPAQPSLGPLHPSGPNRRSGSGPCTGSHHANPAPRWRAMLAVATREATAMAIDDIETYCKNGTWKTRWCNSTKPFAAAASAAELATSAWLTRVKQCDGERCWVLFVDTGKNASRRWCQMRYCGNVAKSHRPAAQRRQVRAAKPRHSSSERNPA